YGRLVFDRLPEVVNADVVAGDLARLLLPPHKRGAGEADESGLRQGREHGGGEHIVLAPVRPIGGGDDVVAVADELVGVELVDEREHVPMVLPEELPQVLTTLCAYRCLRLGNSSYAREVFVDLLVQLSPVGDDDEGPVAWNLSQDLLRE